MDHHVVSDRAFRRSWLLAAAAAAGFAIYISLVPLRFVAPPPGIGLQEWLFSRVQLGSASRSNLAGNFLMFVPFGFFGMGALVRPTARTLWHLTAALLILGLGVLVSVGVETLQAFVPGRTPALADVFAQVVGLATGILAWPVLSGAVRGTMAGYQLGQRRALELILVLYTAIQAVVLLEPFAVIGGVDQLQQRWRAGQIVLDPRASPALMPDNLTSILADTVFAVPVGILAVLIAARTTSTPPMTGALVFVALFYGLGELAQVFIPGRHADVVDLAANLCGATAGAIASVAVLRARLGRFAGLGVRAVALIGLALSVLFYAIHTLIPFDFELTQAMMTARMPRLRSAPFLGYYVNPEFKALRDLFLKMALGLPLGVFGRLAMGSSPKAWKTAAWLVVVAIVTAALEVGQVFLPSRFPDNTDVILATVAAWIGMRLVEPFAHRPPAR